MKIRAVQIYLKRTEFSFFSGLIVLDKRTAHRMRESMKEYKKKTWKHKITGFDGNTILFGVNIFSYKWIRTEEEIEVVDPLYGQEYIFPVYKVFIGENEYKFAAGEFSNSVFGFYVEDL